MGRTLCHACFKTEFLDSSIEIFRRIAEHSPGIWQEFIESVVEDRDFPRGFLCLRFILDMIMIVLVPDISFVDMDNQYTTRK